MFSAMAELNADVEELQRYFADHVERYNSGSKPLTMIDMVVDLPYGITGVERTDKANSSTWRIYAHNPVTDCATMIYGNKHLCGMLDGILKRTNDVRMPCSGTLVVTGKMTNRHNGKSAVYRIRFDDLTRLIDRNYVAERKAHEVRVYTRCFFFFRACVCLPR